MSIAASATLRASTPNIRASYSYRLTTASFMLGDLVAAATTIFAIAALSGASVAGFRPQDGPATLGIALIFPLIVWMFGLYPGVALAPVWEFKRLLGATAGFLLFLVFLVLHGDAAKHSAIVAISVGCVPICTVLCLIARSTVRRLCRNCRWWGVSTVIFGEEIYANQMLATLQRHKELGLRPTADQFGCTHGTELANPCSACYAIIAVPQMTSKEAMRTIKRCAQGYSHVFVMPDLIGLSCVSVSTKEIGGIFGFEVSQRIYQPLPRLLKRSFDLTISLAALILLAPLLLSICIAVLTTSGRPLFYGQRRLGRDGQSFTAYKFRTMRVNADEILGIHLAQSAELRTEWQSTQKLKRDPRITKLGVALRKASLDELPQLWNVVCGRMTLVGPRPIIQAEIERYGESYEAYKLVRPGLTGLWQISGRNNTTYARRVELDEYYVRNWSVWLDLYILCRTIKTLMFAEGAY